MSDLRKQLREHYDAQDLSAEKAEAILARGRAAAAGEDAPDANKVSPFPVPRRISRRWLIPLAAAVLIFAGLAGWQELRERRKTPFEALAPRVVEFFANGPELAKAPQDKAELRSWLLARGAPSDFHIPATLMPLESAACAVVDVRGSKAYLSCYWREQRPDRGDHELVHLLVGRRSDFRDAPSSARPERREMSGWSFASWSERDVIYTLATPAPPEKLTPFLASLGRSEILAFAHQEIRR